MITAKGVDATMLLVCGRGSGDGGEGRKNRQNWTDKRLLLMRASGYIKIPATI